MQRNAFEAWYGYTEATTGGPKWDWTTALCWLVAGLAAAVMACGLMSYGP